MESHPDYIIVEGVGGMNCACGKSNGYYIAKISEYLVILESKCCITTLVCSIDRVEFSV